LGSMTEPNIAFVANLLADPSRAAMCLALAGGEARPAGELAARAGISAQTASNHLAKLTAGRLLRVERQGRWRYYRLAGADVGHAVEALSVVAPLLAHPPALDGMAEAARRLKNARTCYSHLAGRLGVALADALIALRWLEDDDQRYRLTPTGARSLRAIGIEVVPRRAQVPARRCLDWTERRPHVAGPVGTALAKVAFDRGWVRRLRGTRAIAVTPLGRAQLNKMFNVRWEETP
jgi:DNA-binding transcriptional ArsR family regulator